MTQPPQPPHGPSMPPMPPEQGMSTGKKVGLGCGGCLGVLLVLLLLGGCVAALSESASDGGTQESAATEEETPQEAAEEAPAEEEASEEETPAEEPEPEEAPSTIGNGVHRVGEDIEPGTYTTDGPSPDDIMPMCYYARLSGLSGEFDDIIANNNIEGPGSLVVQEGDAALELSGGCEWTLE
ncbi:hypothetical protein HNR06_005375 [Nocardiopsis arvandica]|uniref:Uncharacterized protein n=1 Tax=Nocardiopsis sinuspersici TaxID=501010 RepID=A0A7Z0BM07_9ACTN|nr:hypothetical protein [Nocardiopsis sinuspersici]NYH55786.1 hypothetical protein [Nocardiopsis sinuspersici]